MNEEINFNELNSKEPLHIITSKNGKDVEVDLNATLSTLEEIKNNIRLDVWFTPKKLRYQFAIHTMHEPSHQCIVQRLKGLHKNKFLKVKRGTCKGRKNNIIAYMLTTKIYYDVLPKFKEAFWETAKKRLLRNKDKYRGNY